MMSLRADYYAREKEGPTSLDEYWAFCLLPENRNKTFELVNGRIKLMAGNASSNHQRICGYIFRKIGNYLEGKNCEVFTDLNVYLFEESMGKCKNVYQPDIMVGCDRDKATNRGYEGTPEFIAEVISKSSASHDYIEKYYWYMLYGVKEYWIVDLFQNKIVVYINGNEEEEKPPEINVYSFNDKVKVEIFEDLWIDFKEAAALVSAAGSENNEKDDDNE
jgi:Uma2 family endonuclease